MAEDASQEPNIEELEAQAAAANERLEAARAAAAAPKLTEEEAKDNLAKAKETLEFIERPYWDLEHAKIDLRAAINTAQSATAQKKDAALAEIPLAQQRLVEAQAAFDNHPATTADTDRAAQAVVTAREALAKIQEA